MTKVPNFRVFHSRGEKIGLAVAVVLLIPAAVLAATVNLNFVWAGYPSFMYLLIWSVNIAFDRSRTKAHNEHLRLMEQDFQEHLRRAYGVTSR